LDAVLRAAAVYLFLLLLVRLTGKRSLAQITTFDFVLLLIVAEATQQALLGQDYSLTTGGLAIVTLLAIDQLLDFLAHRFIWVDRWVNGGALVLIEDGRLHRKRMTRVRIDEDEIMESARQSQGIERLEQIKHAVLERTGNISIVPRS
jgi:uncharacterized membrane protein YcaP (DUF421 family)